MITTHEPEPFWHDLMTVSPLEQAAIKTLGNIHLPITYDGPELASCPLSRS
jgi:hypothetical protein